MFGWAANVRKIYKKHIHVYVEPCYKTEENSTRAGVNMLPEESHNPYRVHKEGFEILSLGTQLRRPGDLPFQNFVDGIHVVEVWTLGEKQLSPPGKQTLKQNNRLRRAANQQRGL